MLEAKAQGKIRHIGITNHRLAVANEAIDSGLYETLQFPFCYLATEKDLELVKKCKEADMGFIAMKALSGGLINNSAAAYAFEAQYDNVLPVSYTHLDVYKRQQQNSVNIFTTESVRSVQKKAEKKSSLWTSRMMVSLSADVSQAAETTATSIQREMLSLAYLSTTPVPISVRNRCV